MKIALRFSAEIKPKIEQKEFIFCRILFNFKRSAERKFL